MRRWHQVRALSAYECKILFIALVMLPLIDLLLRLCGFQRTQALLTLIPVQRRNRYCVTETQKLQQGHTLARLIAIAAQHSPYRVTCLRRSLLLWCWLRRQGVVSELQLGVHKTDQPLAAHAWVEYQGIAFGVDGTVRHQFVAFAPKTLENQVRL